MKKTNLAVMCFGLILMGCGYNGKDKAQFDKAESLFKEAKYDLALQEYKEITINFPKSKVIPITTEKIKECEGAIIKAKEDAAQALRCSQDSVRAYTQILEHWRRSSGMYINDRLSGVNNEILDFDRTSKKKHCPEKILTAMGGRNPSAKDCQLVREDPAYGLNNVSFQLLTCK